MGLFLNFNGLFSFSLTWDPMGPYEHFKTLHLTTIIILFQLNFFYIFSVTVFTERAYRNFEILNLNFFKQD